MAGGVMPAGSECSTDCEEAANCATAASTLAWGMEEDLDDGQAGQRLRLHVLDVVDRGGERALAADGDHFGHFFGGDAAVGPDDADHRNVDFGEDVGGHAEGGQDAQDDDHHGHDDEGVGAAEGEADYPHGRWPGGLSDS